MGYGYYVIDSKQCGYLVGAVCEQSGCSTEIDRGLAYACGGDPGENNISCAGYFCSEHLFGWSLEDSQHLVDEYDFEIPPERNHAFVCSECLASLTSMTRGIEYTQAVPDAEGTSELEDA